MKSVLSAATVLIFIATPALSQAFDPDVGTGNIVPPPVTNQNGATRSLNHGQGPGCIQSPASLEYTGCD